MAFIYIDTFKLSSRSESFPLLWLILLFIEFFQNAWLNIISGVFKGKKEKEKEKNILKLSVKELNTLLKLYIMFNYYS